MQITGSYNNYITMTNLLSPLGVGSSSQLVMQVFTSAIGKLQDKIDQKLFSEESTSAINQLYSNVSDIANKAKTLTLTDYNSVFNDRTAASMGSELNWTDASAVNQGVNTFNLNINGQDHEINVEVIEGDTNTDVQQKILQAINDADAGVTAEVVEGSVEGTDKLVITSDNTGAENAFTINDVSGNAVAATGLNNISTEGRDTLYEVDGNAYSSAANSISLDEGMVTVNLRGEGDATLTVRPDQEQVEDAITGFVSEVNSFIDFLDKNSSYIDDKVLSSMNSFMTGKKTSLASLGITEGDDGRLEIDNEQLTAAVSQSPAQVKETFGGFDGLAMQVNNLVSVITAGSPLDYAKEAEDMSMEFADYVYNSSANMLSNIIQGSLLNTYV